MVKHNPALIGVFAEGDKKPPVDSEKIINFAITSIQRNFATYKIQEKTENFNTNLFFPFIDVLWLLQYYFPENRCPSVFLVSGVLCVIMTTLQPDVRRLESSLISQNVDIEYIKKRQIVSTFMIS